MIKDPSAERALRESLKIVKDETGRVKTSLRASTMAGTSAVKMETTPARPPPGQKEGKTASYPTPASDFEPSEFDGVRMCSRVFYKPSQGHIRK